MNLEPVEILPDTPQLKMKTPAERIQEGGGSKPNQLTGKHKAVKAKWNQADPSQNASSSVKNSLRWKLIAGILALGFGIGGYFVGGKLARSSPGPVVEETPPPTTTRGLDELILDNDWSTALKLARFRYKTGPTAQRAALRYREAIILEASGDVKAAAEIFAQLAESNRLESAPARLGLARCRLAENRLEEARTLLAGLVLLSESESIKANSLGAEAAYFQVRLAMIQLNLTFNPSPWDELGLAQAKRNQELARFLSWVPIQEPKRATTESGWHAVLHQDEASDPDATSQELEPDESLPPEQPELKNGSHPDPKTDASTVVWSLKPHPHFAYRSLVTAKAPSLAVTEVLEMIRQELKIPVTVMAEVQEKFAGKQYPVDIKGITLGDFLSVMLEPFDCQVIWTERSCTIQFASDNREERYDQAKKLIQRALVIGPDHPERYVCLVDLGNLEVESKNYKEAMTTYSKLLRDGGLTQEAIPAAYNLGLMQLRFGDRKGARETFQNVADRDLQGKWVPLAHYWAGRAALENDDLELALSSFQRAIKANPESVSARAAALGSAHVYLLMDSPAEARAVLRPYKTILKQEPTRSAVALIDSYARYKLAPRPKATGETDDLTQAVLSSGDRSPLGPAGLLLMGYAAREVGLDIKLTQLFDQASENLSGPLGIRFITESGEQYYLQGDWDKALARFRAVAAVDQGRFGIQARLRLVDLCLKQYKKNEAFQYAREAIRLPNCDRQAGLKALGRCYESLGDHTRALACFSGQLPE